MTKKPTRAYREKTISESPRNTKKPLGEFPEFTYNPNSLLLAEDNNRF